MSSIANRTRRLYPEVSSEERFHLVIAALARQDLTEYRQLTLKAPKVAVSMLDPDLLERMEQLRSLTWWFLWRSAEPIGMLKLLEGLIVTVRETMLGTHPPFDPILEVVVELLEACRAVPVERIRVWRDAFLEVAQKRLDLRSETVLALQMPEVAAVLESYRDLIEAAEPEDEAWAEARAELEEAMEPARLDTPDREVS